MRALVLYTLLSIDGVAEEPGDWMFDVDQEVFDNLADVIRQQDTVLLGRATYDYWVDHWPTSEVEPFAGFINSTTKHVFTSTPLLTPWAQTQAVAIPPQEYVAALKREPGGDVGVHGSLTLAQALLGAGLVDELRLVVAPTLAGRGRRLFDVLPAPRRLHLVEQKRSSGGNLLLRYRVS